MAPARRTRRRALAWCVAAAVAVGPALSWAAHSTAPTLRAVADEPDCADGLVMNPDTLECLPVVSPTGTSTASSDFSPAPNFTSAPSEMDLTDSNPGIASPESHAGR